MSEGKVFSEDFELTSNSAEGDPSRMPRWGTMTAKPSEYLIVYRNGELQRSRSGQGARCWIWPWDTVAIVPTTLKEVLFQANQITVDNVDVRLRGMVLYRIADPLKIYRLVNFSYRSKAEAKLARMIADMCRSTAKWLVANMGVEECVRRRKEEIARALRDEVSAVVSSEGPEGWGVEIVTIDIQDIYIQDAALFEAMQAGFKAERDREAELARLAQHQEVERRRLETERELDEARHAIALERAAREAKAELARLERQREEDERRFALERSRIEAEQALELFKLEQRRERDRLEAEAAAEQARRELEAERARNEESARALRERLGVEDGAGRASLERLFVTEALPELSRALAGALEGARFHVSQGEGSGPLMFAFQQLSELLEARLDALPATPGEKNGQGR